MKQHLIIAVLVAIHTAVPAGAQFRPGDEHGAMAPRFLDPTNGITLEQAIGRALEREPGLRAARADIDVARGARVQAGLKPNPTISFAQQVEPGGTDAQTRLDLEWPLDLSRKTGRVNVADREIEVIQHATADRERRLVSEVRLKFGEVLTAVRELSVTDELVAVTARQQALMNARAAEGSIAPLERDMVSIELRRLEADRMLQAGHAEHAMIELRRLLGLAADAPLTLREDLDQVVQREIAPTLPASNTSADARPDVQEAEARIDVANARIDQAHREGSLDLSVFAMFMRMDAGFPQRGFGLDNELQRVHGVFHYVAGGVTISLPFRDSKKGDLAVAEAQRVSAEAGLEAARLTAQAEVAAARARDDHARRALVMYGAEIRVLARQNLDVVTQTYELGRMTLLDVVNERRRYLDAERGYTNALREAYDARQALRTALGDVR